MRRIGWLAARRRRRISGPHRQSFEGASHKRDWLIGRNIEIVFRYANGRSDRLAELSAELIAQKPDLLLAVGGPVVMPLFEASKGGVPIVGGVSDSPIRRGLAVSLARPGKNFTGFTFLTDEMAAKRIATAEGNGAQRKTGCGDI